MNLAYSALIVDDEAIIRRGLRDTLKWKPMGFERVECAENGEQALEMTAQMRPDLVITDVMMPMMDGLEYIQRLHAANLSVKIIILSGYDRFAFAQRAISYGAFAYLLKPVENAELEAQIQRAMTELEESRAARRDFLQAKASERRLQRFLLADLARGFYDKESEALEDLEEYGLSMLSTPCWGGLLYPADGDEIQDLRAIRRDLDSFMEREKGHALIIGKDFFLIAPLGKETMMAQAERLLKEICERLGSGWNLALGGSGRGPLFPYQLLREAEFTISLAPAGRGMVVGPLGAGAPHTWEQHLVEALRKGNFEGVDMALDQYWTAARRGQIRLQACREGFRGLFKWVIQMAQDQGNFSWAAGMDPMNRLNAAQSLNQLEKVVRGVLMDAARRVRTQAHTRPEIDQALDYMNANYQNPLTLNQVASHVHLSPCYLSRVFKRETGAGFLECLSRIRVEKAMELIRAGDDRVYEVAGKVGYTDAVYFGQIFKKFVHKTPQEFARAVRGEQKKFQG